MLIQLHITVKMKENYRHFSTFHIVDYKEYNFKNEICKL